MSTERNARVFGNAWVYGNALVSEDARVDGNARVFGNARVYGNAWVCGNARVFGNARVYGNAQVFGNARVYGNAQVFGNAELFEPHHCIVVTGLTQEPVTVFRTRKGHQVAAGCQTFTLDDDLVHIAADNAWDLPLGWETLVAFLRLQVAQWHTETTEEN